MGGSVRALLAKYSKPRDFVNAAIALDFNKKPLAKDHLKWYLDGGAGRDYYEDGVITSWIKEDPGIRLKLRGLLNEAKQPIVERSGHFGSPPFNRMKAVHAPVRDRKALGRPPVARHALQRALAELDMNCPVLPRDLVLRLRLEIAGIMPLV